MLQDKREPILNQHIRGKICFHEQFVELYLTNNDVICEMSTVLSLVL